MSFPPIRFDLTTLITEDTVLFPDDPIFKVTPCCSLEKNGFRLSRIEMGNHTGTHIDFPAHIVPNGQTSSDYGIDDLIGNGLIICVPAEAHSVSAKLVAEKKADILEVSHTQGAFVFFKTKNSDIPKVGAPVQDYVYIEPEAAETLLDMGVRIIGIDYISVDKVDADDLPVHKILLSKGVLIVENLNLAVIKPGKYQISIIPLYIPDMDGLPVRVIAEMR